MSRPKVATILTEDERDEAKALGADIYLRSFRYRKLRQDHVLTALDGAVAAMEALRFPNPYDGRVLGALARVLFANDRKALGYLRNRKVAALDDPEKRQELFTYAGLLIAEDYLSVRRSEVPAEIRLASPDELLDDLGALFELMAAAGRRLSDEDVLKQELAVTFETDGDPGDIARTLVEDAIGTYESLVPETADEDIPAGVQRRAMSKAAFLRLGADDLAELAAREGETDLPNKSAMAEALTRKYGDDLDKVAELVVRQAEGDAGFGLVTRLVPLPSPPDLDTVAHALEALRGRYFEPRTATFFIFGEVRRGTNVVSVDGRIRSFTVNPAEAGGKTQLNFRPHTENVTVTLRAGEAWVETNARRAGDLNLVRSMLRRTAELQPSVEPIAPAPLTRDPYSGWDVRTLWMLEFLRRDLQAETLRLDDTLMANFISARRPSEEAEDAEEAGEPEETEETGRTPTLEAVRLLGQQLHDHPEACIRIAAGAQLRDIDVRIRQVTDQQRGHSELVRFRLSWEKDHIAVLSGAHDGRYSAPFHQQIVRLVRAAAARELDEEGLLLTLRRIERRASEGIGDGNDAGLFDAPEQQSDAS